MKDARIEKLADLLVNYSVAVKPGQKVAIRGSVYAEPLVRQVYIKTLQAGGFPYVMASFPSLDEEFYRYASEEQLKHVFEPYQLVVDTYDVIITLMADANTKALSQVDPSKMAMRSRAHSKLFETYLGRAARGELRWTLTLFPTEAHAMDAEMSLGDFEDFVFQACMPDINDPVRYWRKFSARQDKIIDWLKGKRQVHVLGPETDLTLSVEGRTFINCDCHENVPDGEIFTGPIEDSVNGHVYFTYPAIEGGREVSGVRLWFENGKVVKATAEKNEEYLLKMLDTDEGARYVGEFAIGTNEGITRFTRNILYDEKIGGSFHMAVGSGYPETGSKNTSSIHWDMICDLRHGGQILVDGELLYKDGKFTV
jgi:aminopeptidase